MNKLSRQVVAAVSFFLVATLTFSSCNQGMLGSRKMTDLERLASMMSGSFSSEEQSIADTTYFDIRLEMKPIWTERTDGHWFYVEQAVSTYLDKPYRQRVYHLTQLEDGSFSSEVYTLFDPARFAGVWKEENPLSALSPDSLSVREGCAIIMKKNEDGSYEGKTGDKSCGSNLRGASYATSEVVIEKDQLISWDRGWDEAGEQVWGAEVAGYIFKKLER